MKKIKPDCQKRHEVYNETKQLMMMIFRYSRIDDATLMKFNLVIKESKHLFEDDVNRFLSETLEKSFWLTLNYHTIEKDNKQPTHTISRNILIEEIYNLRCWFHRNFNNIEERFVKYLDFRNI
jgi:hypothetical protein